MIMNLVLYAGAAAAGHGLEDLDLFAVLFDQVADVDAALEASVGVILFPGGWLRGCARLLCGHRVHSLWSG